MNKILDIRHFTPSSTDRFLFDTNVWIYLFYPMGDYYKNKASFYAGFFAKARNAHSELLISSLIISEFINRYLRLEFAVLHEKMPEKYNDYKKDYRATDEFLEDMELIKNIVQKKILGRTHHINDDFSETDKNLIFDNVDNHYDFNDIMHQLMALSHKSLIVTDDADFASSRFDVTILTANRQMLSQNQNSQ